MLSQNKKKIYIINFNPKDFFDLTLEALENLRTSDLIISTQKLDKKFKNILNKINRTLEVNTELSKNKVTFRKYLISKLGIFNSISYLHLGDFNITKTFFDDNILGKKGASVQRYKGLGEMNPDQLWETTLDPEFRSLLQVKIDDAQRADEIFEQLMGDDVDKRKMFIQSNAEKVVNLDV